MSENTEQRSPDELKELLLSTTHNLYKNLYDHVVNVLPETILKQHALMNLIQAFSWIKSGVDLVSFASVSVEKSLDSTEEKKETPA